MYRTASTDVGRAVAKVGKKIQVLGKHHSVFQTSSEVQQRLRGISPTEGTYTLHFALRVIWFLNLVHHPEF
jgi:hypothetical protein